MVTNYHVVADKAIYTSVKGSRVVKSWLDTGPNDTDARPEVSAFGIHLLNQSRDLAILQIEKPLSHNGRGMHRVPLFAGQLKNGESVTILGYPNGKLTAATAHFRVTAEQRVLEFDLDSPLSYGCSGGLVLNSRNEAIGVLYGVSIDWRTAFAIPVWTLADFIKKTNPTLYADLFPLSPVRPSLGSGKVENKSLVEILASRDAGDRPANLKEVALLEPAGQGDVNQPATHRKAGCLKKPSRPTTAVEIYHYVMAVFPLYRTAFDRKPYYRLAIQDGIEMGTPYNVTEEEALARVQNFYYEPVQGTSSREIAAFFDLLTPRAQAHPVEADASGTHFKVDVEAANIPEPEPWGVIISPQPSRHSVEASQMVERDECRVAPIPELAPAESPTRFDDYDVEIGHFPR
jgi:hypothetical protein